MDIVGQLIDFLFWRCINGVCIPLVGDAVYKVQGVKKDNANGIQFINRAGSMIALNFPSLITTSSSCGDDGQFSNPSTFDIGYSTFSLKSFPPVLA
jgi:hypothetical protein